MTNRFKTHEWKSDSWASVDFYNRWFMASAPEAFKTARKGVMNDVLSVFKKLDYLRNIDVDTVKAAPEIMQVIRACTAPPLALERLSGLALTKRGLLQRMEEGKLPLKISSEELSLEIEKVLSIIRSLLDVDIFPWLKSGKEPSLQAVNRSASIVSDRLTGSLCDPIIRNAQEERQLKAIDDFLTQKGYRYIVPKNITSPESMPPLTFSHHFNIPERIADKVVNMPIDVVIQTANSKFPLLIECKSAGDFTNTNKRRKEEAVKSLQLQQTYGENVNLILFLCGYFDVTYLGYEAAEGIDWVWENRISDFEQFGV